MDVETALQGAHDLQGTLVGDVEVAQAGEAAGGAIVVVLVWLQVHQVYR